MKTLLHVCCGPCASACVERLAAEGDETVMFFSNCNLDSEAEFRRRAEAAAALAAHDGVPIVFDEYDHEAWLREVADGFENEPEKGARCARCFRFSLARAARYAAEHGFDGFTTSLTVSPHKVSATVFAATEDPRFRRIDFKKRQGFLRSVRRTAELGLYRQTYCGCEFSRRAAAVREAAKRADAP